MREKDEQTSAGVNIIIDGKVRASSSKSSGQNYVIWWKLLT